MTHKERVLASVSHRTPDRVPIDYSAHPKLHEAVVRHLGLPPNADLGALLGVDLRGVGPGIRRQASPVCYADPTREVTDDGLLVDLWGVGFRVTSTPTGEYVDLAHSPLTGLTDEAELDTHEFMDPDDWDYSGVAAAARAQADYCVWAHSRGTFEISWFLRGLDGFLTDLALEPGRACGLMDRVQERLVERLTRVLDAGGEAIHMVEYNDDVGGQGGLVMSPAMWREYLKPRIARVFDLIRSRGKVVRYHSCGSIRAIIPDLIDIGLQVLNPIQPLATAMDPLELKREFGHALTLHGGIDVQQLLPCGSVREVREHVARLRDVLAEDGGWIACSSHAMQPDTPPENVVALYETLLGHPLA
jgi:uroporphyrinogen decarboxylase